MRWKKKDSDVVEAEIVHEPEIKPPKQSKKAKKKHKKENRKIKPVERKVKKKVIKHRPNKKKRISVVISPSFIHSVELSALLGLIIYLTGPMGLIVVLGFILFVLYQFLWGDVEW